MLTADLLRASVRKGVITPRLLDPQDEQLQRLADELVAIFRTSSGSRRVELDDRIGDIVGDETHFAIVRGLVKLLHDRSTWETVAPLDPVELRRLVFEASAAAHPVGTRASRLHATTRDDVLAAVAESLGATAMAVEDGMYADLKSEQRLTRFRDVEPLALLHRYNLAQAQGLLLRAHRLDVHVETARGGALRQLFRALKFHQLMHRTQRDGEGWRITIDGPLSLFEQSQRYGLQMARFLPSLLLTEQWRLEAEVEWTHAPTPVRLVLDPDSGLVTHLRAKGAWVSAEERTLRERVDASDTSWSVSRRVRVVDLDGQDVFVPDFIVRCAKTDREALVEIVGFWRADYLRRRAELLAAHGPPNLVLCVSRRLAAGGDVDIEALGEHVIDFANVIPIGRFLETVERVAC